MQYQRTRRLQKELQGRCIIWLVHCSCTWSSSLGKNIKGHLCLSRPSPTIKQSSYSYSRRPTSAMKVKIPTGRLESHLVVGHPSRRVNDMKAWSHEDECVLKSGRYRPEFQFLLLLAVCPWTAFLNGMVLSLST